MSPSHHHHTEHGLLIIHSHADHETVYPGSPSLDKMPNEAPHHHDHEPPCTEPCPRSMFGGVPWFEAEVEAQTKRLCHQAGLTEPDNAA